MLANGADIKRKMVGKKDALKYQRLLDTKFELMSIGNSEKITKSRATVKKTKGAFKDIVFLSYRILCFNQIVIFLNILAKANIQYVLIHFESHNGICLCYRTFHLINLLVIFMPLCF